MMALYVTGLFTVFFFLFYYYFNYWKLRKIPGPKPEALFGNIKNAVLRRCNFGILSRELYEKYPNEKVIGIYRMISPSLLLRDLDVIKHVLIKDFDNFADRGVEFKDKNLGSNIFSASEKLWRPLRNWFTPLFTTAKLKNMLYLIDEKGDKFIDYVNELVTQQSEQNVYSLVQKYTISTISACAFGIDVDINNVEYMKTLSKIDKLVFTKSYIQELFIMFPNVLKHLNMSLFPQEVVNFFNNLVKNVLLLRDNTPSKRKDFMDLILELRQQSSISSSKHTESDNEYFLEITDNIIASQAFVFYVAGYETSATTMMFTMYELAMNPDIQEKVIAEVDEGLKKCNGNVTYETISELTYMKKVFDETLRKYPIVDTMQRVAKANYEIPDTKVTIEKGQIVLIPAIGIHYDEEYYPNPSRFDPERFSVENVAKRHPCAYIPFGVGPRNCIGMRFAKIQSRLCLLKIFSKFRLQPSKNTPSNISFDPYRVVLSPKNGMLLNLIPRRDDK